MVASAPKIMSPHDPIDIGDHHLSIGHGMFSDWITICQKRSDRSSLKISNAVATSINGSAMIWAVRAIGDRPRP
jgi:hypothetical protein